jgi:hypothetical protein
METKQIHLGSYTRQENNLKALRVERKVSVRTKWTKMKLKVGLRATIKPLTKSKTKIL